jgi:cysteine desulfuration protein SufE
MNSLDDMVDAFELLGDWEQRYQFLVELGDRLPAMPEALKTDDNKVKGCMSQVWVAAYPDPSDSSSIRFHGDCDTSIIKGVLALLVQLVSGKTAGQIDALDLDELFRRLMLDEHLSPNRHVGVYAIVELMKHQARQLRSSSRQVA